jgi:hypothetical protein
MDKIRAASFSAFAWPMRRFEINPHLHEFNRAGERRVGPGG